MKLEQHRHGKARVRLVKVTRRGEFHDLRDVTVRLMVEGDFAASFTGDDNRKVVPTDTLKNTVYALARTQPVDRIERFGLALARHVLETHAPVARVAIELEEVAWARLAVRGPEGPVPHPHAFTRLGDDRATAMVTAVRGGAEEVSSGLTGLRLARTGGSGFEGFPREGFTTLKETGDRILATEVTATWSWSALPQDPAVANARIRQAMLEAFAEGHSPSVQRTLHRMAEAALAAAPEAARIHLVLPNLHCLPVDLSPFGLDNPNEVFVATEEPHGMIEATLARE